MKTIELAPGCQRWQPGDATKHPPIDVAFLKALSDAGFLAFTGPSGLCGGKSETRAVIAIHRGRGKRWELIFREHDSDVVTTMTTDLPKATSSVLTWLQGKPLTVAPDSLRDVA